MARPSRIPRAGAWHHAKARGSERRDIFRTEEDQQKFLSLVSELPDRFRVEIHAFVLLDNHHHLLVRTSEANLNHAIRWLNVSCVVWFNWKHRRVGHLFQERYRSEVIEEIAGVSEVARYAQHLMDGARVNREQETSVRRLARSMIDW